MDSSQYLEVVFRIVAPLAQITDTGDDHVSLGSEKTGQVAGIPHGHGAVYEKYDEHCDGQNMMAY